MRELPEHAAAARTANIRDSEGHNLEEARRYAGQALSAARDHGWRLRALEPVFGPAVRAAAEEHLERLTESSSEAVFHYERVIEAVDGERSDLRAEIVHLRSRLTNLEHELDRTRELPEIVLERGEAYFSRLRKRSPKWLLELRRTLRPPAPVLDDEEPF